MKALSIRQPWAWLIVNGFKDIENRSWHTKYRGPVLIHASKGLTRKEYDEACATIVDRLISVDIPDFDDLQRGGIMVTQQSPAHAKAVRHRGFLAP